MNLRRFLGMSGAAILVVASWRGHGTDAGVAPEPLPGARTAAAAPLTAWTVQGAGSCSATACHGSMAPAARAIYPSRVLRNEHTTWITQDRHADAYRVLLTRRSQEIASRLAGRAAAAERDARCLACHATAGNSPAPLTAPLAVVQQDGVSCESCHGPAERWLGAHTQLGWSRLSPAEKESRFGMRPTRELHQRAAICVECHVGSPGRDVNHDLIAAGHPRLTFEFAAFLANMPPHWVEDVGGNFPARAWAVGQAVTARAAADLLAVRAGAAVAGAAGGAAWPEFSEYDCFACHHDLADQAWRPSRSAQGGAPGIPAWGTWYYPSVLMLARHGGRGDPRALEERFVSLRAEMGRLDADPGKVAAAAQGVSQALTHWLQRLPEESRSYDAPRLRALIAAARTRAPDTPAGWDTAAQRYLALQPLRLALKALDPAETGPASDNELRRLFDALQFPRGYDSPRWYDPAQGAGNP